MKRLLPFLFAIIPAAFAQSSDHSATNDHATVAITRAAQSALEIREVADLPHPYHVEARHPKADCAVTEYCGELFYSFEGKNLRTSAGTTWQSQLMSDTSSPSDNNQCNYLAATNTAITPAMADTTLSGEISSNGLSRAKATYTDGSGVVSPPGAPTVSNQGSAGSTTLWYAVLAVNQGIYTTVGTGTSTTTANSTLSATNYNHVSWTPVAGATGYFVVRNTSNSFSGTLTAVAGRDGTSQPDCSSATCYIDDIANTLGGTSVALPGSNLTNYGHFTLVHTWTATSAQSAQAFGVFTASSSGTMCFEGTFTQVALNTNDTLQLTETVNF